MSRQPKSPRKPTGKKPVGKATNRSPEGERSFTNTGKRKILTVDIEMVGALKIVRCFSPDEIEFEDGGDHKTDFEPTDQVFYSLEEEIKQCLENAGIQAEFSLDTCYFETIHIEYAQNKRTKGTK